MSFENPGSERLNEEEAHDEANMLRASVSRESDTIEENAPNADRLVRGGREATAEDYEKALEALEELKQSVKEESPAFVQGIIKFNQLVKTYGAIALYVGRAVDAAMGKVMGEASLKENWETSQHLSDALWDEIFSDCPYRKLDLSKRVK